MANIVQHNLQDLLSQADAGETNGQGGDRALDRQDGEKINHLHALWKCPGNIGKGVSHAKKSGEGRQVRGQRRPEREQSRYPMSRVKMISC